MSSKLLRPDDEPSVEPLRWRNIHAGSTDSAPSEQGPSDDRLQMERIRQEMAQRVQEAQAQGRREGEAAGRAQGVAEVRPVIDRLTRTIHDRRDCRPARASAPGG